MNLRHLNLFDNTTVAITAKNDGDYEESWEAPWDTKAAILLGQGIFITILVAILLCACGRKHYRRMNLMRVQELTTIRIQMEMSDGTTAANANDIRITTEDGRNSAEQTRLQRIRHMLATPLRFIDSLVNSWASSPSTDFEYYDRILQRMEREKESRREGVEDRTKRLMNAFVKGHCVWEIEDEHFIPPCSTKESLESEDYSEEKNGVQIDEPEFDVENGLREQIGNIYSAFHDKMERVALPNETSEENTTNEEADLADYKLNNDDLEEKTEFTEKNNGSDFKAIECDIEAEVNMEGNSLTPVGEANDQISSTTACVQNTESKNDDSNIDIDGANTTEQLSRSVSFDSSVPSYLYLDLNQNRIRANSTGSSPTTANSTNIPASSSEPTLSLAEHINRQRTISNQCAICLCDYNKGDTLVISSNTSCPHGFHQECIIEWLVKMQEGTPCPCCRQTFVELEQIDDTRATRGREMSEEELGALRRHLQLGMQRGRAFNASVIRF